MNYLQSLPPRFVARLEEIIPSDRYAAVEASFRLPRAAGFRVNLLKAEREPVIEELKQYGLHPRPVSWYPDAFQVDPEEREALLTSQAYKKQQIYVQNLSSMIPPLILDPEPGERVLDLAAAPGSKTLQIASMMNNTGEIAAVEVVRSRFFKMRDNLLAQGTDSVRTFLKDGASVWRHRPEYFDRVLLDAPCTTEGRFSVEEPETYAYWTLRKIKEMANKQRRLLYSGIQALRPGGILVYSTCTFAPEENEAIISQALDRFGGAIRAEPLALNIPEMLPALEAWQGRSFHPDIAQARRILPDALMEGFFVCKLTKTHTTL